MNMYKYVENLRPIPKYIRKKIEQIDRRAFPEPYKYVRFYAYLTVWRKYNELIKITVAVKHYRKKLYMKQVAVHTLHCPKCFVKDMEYNYFGGMGFRVGWFAEGLQKRARNYESEFWCYADTKYYDPFATVINLDVIDRFPEYKYSAYRQFQGVDILKYLRYYEKYPQTEFLVKFGFSRYVFSKLILKKTAKDKAFRKWLISHKDDISNGWYYVSTLIMSYRTGKPLEYTQNFLSDKKTFLHDGYGSRLRKFFRGRTDKFLEYISKQHTHYRTYLDYFDACNYLGLDMTEDKNVFPHDFKRWHDIRIDEYHTAKVLKDAEERKELYKTFEAVAEKYLPLQREQQDAFIVVIAKSPAELIREGDALHHCVGRMNYDQRFIREESLIFFVRNVNEPDVPFVTVEYSVKNKRILQVHGINNSRPNVEVENFIQNKWLPYANRKLKQINKAA